MTELLTHIKSMLDETIELENSLMIGYNRLSKAYEGLGNEKAVDVAGLKRPNLIPFMIKAKEHKEELEALKFHLETQIKDNDERRKKEIMIK